MKAKCWLIPILLSCILPLMGCYGFDYKDPVHSAEDILNKIPELEKYVTFEMKAYGIEKVSISVFSNDRIIYSRFFNAKEDEQFRAASIGKPLVSYAALKLVEEGKLELDKPLRAYLNRGYFGDNAKGDRITLRMVLNHTSGMSNYVNKDDRTIYSEPGTEFHYSGTGFEYLKNVIEEITALPFNDFIKKEVFDPLRMTKSRFGYEMIQGEKAVSAAGGFITTPDDVARFFMELLNPENIRKDLIDQMISDSIKLNENNSWGLGIGIQRGIGGDVIWHNGNTGNLWISLAYAAVKEKTGVVILTKGKNGYKIYQDIAHTAIGGSYYGLQKNIDNTGVR
jgi:CubicO group peptidase (beta-lactamase class C family)